MAKIVNRKSISLIAIVVVTIISLVVLKTVPLKEVTEDYGSETLSLKNTFTVSTTLVVKKGWTASGSYSASSDGKTPSYGHIDFYIYAPDGKTIIFERTNALSGTFSFVSDSGGSYVVRVSSSHRSITSVTLEARQTGKTTII